MTCVKRFSVPAGSTDHDADVGAAADLARLRILPGGGVGRSVGVLRDRPDSRVSLLAVRRQD